MEPSLPRDPDGELMEAVAAGDPDAFRKLVERHQHLVIGTIARMIGPSEAEDLAQQVFLNVWKAAPRWRPSARFTTWLLTIARRIVFNESRRRMRARVRLSDRSEETEVEAPSPEHPPDAEMSRRELHDEIRAAIALLPEKERFAVVLRQYEGLSYEEIAGALDTSVSAVKSLLFRARTTLRSKLERHLGD
jgi:RNA polymerase sigma-70 factor, ECF subfamily